MSDARFEIDYDAEAIFHENGWHTRDELAQRIKGMIDRGDYRVALPSSLLERLEAALASARVVAARVSPELAEAVEARAVREGRSAASIVREALDLYLKSTPQRPSAVLAARTPGPGNAVKAAAGVAAPDEAKKDESWFGS